MKLKYILPAFIAMFAALVSCSDEEEPKFLNDLRVSSSYVALSQLGGETTITVNAMNDWSFDAESLPSWLTVSPMNGSKGETTVTFSAPETIDGRIAEIKLNCGSNTQLINIIQGLPVVPDATCAEVIAGPESKTYRVKGVVTAIANTTYGNFYLNDGTGEIYIYGTKDSSGNYNWAKFGIEVGDEVTVQGPKTVYNGVIELVDATFIKVSKSLIKVEAAHVVGDEESTVLPLEGGKFQVDLTCKGQGVSVEIPEDLKSWVSIESIKNNSKGATVIFNIAKNEGGDREGKLVFTTTDGKKNYSAETSFSQKGSIIAATVADILAAEVGGTIYRVTGMVLTVDSKYGNNIDICDWSGKIYSYKTGNCTDVVKVGDIITMTGKRGEYKGPQIVDGVVEEVLASTISKTLAEFVALEDNDGNTYCVKAVVKEVKNDKYGNMVLESEDGTVTAETYGCYGVWGNTGADAQYFVKDRVAAGDIITIVGGKSSYNGTIQMKNAYCVAIEKAAE